MVERLIGARYWKISARREIGLVDRRYDARGRDRREARSKGPRSTKSSDRGQSKGSILTKRLDREGRNYSGRRRRDHEPTRRQDSNPRRRDLSEDKRPGRCWQCRSTRYYRRRGPEVPSIAAPGSISRGNAGADIGLIDAWIGRSLRGVEATPLSYSEA